MFIKSHRKTILDAMFEQEIKEFADTFKANSDMSHTVQDDTNMKGDVIYPIDLQLQSVVNLLSNTSYCQTTFPIVTHNYEPLFNAVTGKILTIEGEHTFVEALKAVLPFIEKAGPNFYGALFRNGNTIINPFNIAAVISHINSYAEKSPKFKIMLYFYPNRAELDLTYNSEKAEREMMTTNIDNLLKSRASKVDITSRIIDVEISETGNITVLTGTKSKTVSRSSYNANKENYIVAHQGITRGVIAPYYGYSALTKEKTGSATGFHLSPFLCANISYSAPRAVTDRINYTSVCTGSQPRNTLKGLTALTQCNMLSPYNRSIILDGALVFADISINKALDIYYKAGLISTIPLYTLKVEKIEIDPELLKIAETGTPTDIFDYFLDKVGPINAMTETKNFLELYEKYKKGLKDVENKTDTTNSDTSADDTTSDDSSTETSAN